MSSSIMASQQKRPRPVCGPSDGAVAISFPLRLMHLAICMLRMGGSCLVVFAIGKYVYTVVSLYLCAPFRLFYFRISFAPTLAL